MLRPFIQKAIDRIDLTHAEATTAAHVIMRGEATPAQIGAWLACMRLKGETEEEIFGIAQAMREHALPLKAPHSVTIDTCGTGGDGLSTFNVSTTAALITAASGVSVAKHGNRSVSSRCGSADVLESLGIDIDPGSEIVTKCLGRHNFGFLFAPIFHPAMRHVVGPRREIAVRTVFNILGPLTNPARVKRQVIGLFAQDRMRTIAKVLRDLGSEHVLVVRGPEGADELLPTGANLIVELKNGTLSDHELNPVDVGVKPCRLEDLRSDGVEACAADLIDILENRPGPKLETAVLNAGAALFVSGHSPNIAEGVEEARQTIADGKAMSLLNSLRAVHRAPAGDKQ